MQRTKTAMFAYVSGGAQKATYIIVEQVGLFVQLLILLEDLLCFSFQLRHSLHSHSAKLHVAHHQQPCRVTAACSSVQEGGGDIRAKQ